MTCDDESPRDVVAPPCRESYPHGLRYRTITQGSRFLVFCTEELAASQKPRAVMSFVDTHRLCQARWPGRKKTILRDPRAVPAHLIDPHDRLPRTQKDRLAFAIASADDIGAPVHPVGEIDVQVSGRAVHHLGPWRYSPVSVRARIDTSAVSLELHESDRHPAFGTVMDE